MTIPHLVMLKNNLYIRMILVNIQVLEIDTF